MIREIAATLAGVLSGLVAILVVLFYPGVTNSATMTSTGLYRSPQIVGPIYAPANLRFYSETSGVSGMLPASLLVLLALGAGIIVSHVGVRQLKGEEMP